MTIFGSDVSHYDGADTRAMLGQVKFQTHKAGGDVDDPEIATWWNYVKDYRPVSLLGAYWVLYPGTPAARADRFIGRLDDTCPGWRDYPFILQADCEQWAGDAATVPSIAEINAFCARLVERMPKLTPVVYAPKWVYGNQVSALHYPIWASSYVTGVGSPAGLYPGDSSSHWAAYGGKIPTILQYTSSATIGGQSTCDANAFRGTLDQLTALVAPGWDLAMALSADDVVAIRDAILNDKVIGNPDGSANKVSLAGVLVPAYSEARAAHLGTDQANDALASVAMVVAGLGQSRTDPAAVAAALVEAGIGAQVATELIALLTAPTGN